MIEKSCMHERARVALHASQQFCLRTDSSVQKHLQQNTQGEFNRATADIPYSTELEGDEAERLAAEGGDAAGTCRFVIGLRGRGIIKGGWYLHALRSYMRTTTVPEYASHYVRAHGQQYAHTHIYTYIHNTHTPHTYLSTHIHIYKYANIHTHVNISTYRHIQKNANIHTKHNANTGLHTHIHAHTHTHQSFSLSQPPPRIFSPFLHHSRYPPPSPPPVFFR